MSGLSVTSVLPDEVTVELSGGPARFHAIWLRDNARDDASRHTGNDQRLFDVTELPDHVVVRAAEVVDGQLRVEFEPDGAISTMARRGWRPTATTDRSISRHRWLFPGRPMGSSCTACRGGTAET